MAHDCDNCGFRAKYERNPKSFLGRIWRWHTSFCPGCKRYMTSLPDYKMAEIAERYDMKKYKSALR